MSHRKCPGCGKTKGTVPVAGNRNGYWHKHCWETKAHGKPKSKPRRVAVMSSQTALMAAAAMVLTKHSN